MTAAAMATAVARAGTAVVRRLANATARVLDHEFEVHKREVPGVIGLGGGLAQSTAVIVDAVRADIDAAPVDLIEGVSLQVDSECWRITQRTDRPTLGQVTFHLEPAA